MKPGGWKQALSSRQAVICLLLTCATLAVYWSVATCEFVNYDDDAFVYQNEVVSQGLTGPGLRWGLTTSYFDFWHPLTWWSHMLDVELFGLAPAGHHLVNLAFHLANVLLLFWIFYHATGAWKRSAIVAALFALHPTHVESVAWVAERKDVLSTFFLLLSILGYVRYGELKKAEGPSNFPATDQNPKAHGHPPMLAGIRASTLFFVLSLAAFALGLMSKAMVVTLPFVLLLLDVWPLQRIGLSRFRARLGFGLLLEKIPFFALTIGSCVITLLGMKAGGNLLSTEQAPWSLRLANVPVSYVRYLGKLLWPADLTVLYPMAKHWPGWQVAAACLVLICVSIAVLLKVRQKPYLAVGWFIFLGTLVPVIGLAANGLQSIADRYLYIPSLGLFAAAVWGLADVAPRLKLRPAWAAGAAVVVLTLFGAVSYHQLGFWRNSFALWSRCLTLTRDNPAAEYNMGVTLQKRGQTNEALVHFTKAQELKPDYFDMNNLGVAYAMAGRLKEATTYFNWSLRLKADYPKNLEDLASALLQLGDFEGAIEHSKQAARLGTNQLRPLLCMARAAAALGKTNEAVEFYSNVLQLDPNQLEAHTFLGQECLRRGQLEEGIEKMRQLVTLQPESAEARFQYAIALMSKGAISEAISQYRQALRLAPNATAVLNNLAWLLATYPETPFRNGTEAVELSRRACELSSYREPIFLGTLAAAYAEAGQFEQAREAARKACALASAANQTNLLARNQELLRLYETGKPYREGK